MRKVIIIIKNNVEHNWGGRKYMNIWKIGYNKSVQWPLPGAG